MERDPNEEDEAAFVDAFFLPGGILDPEDDSNNKNDTEEEPSLPPSLLFSGPSGTWLDSPSVSGGAPISLESATPWFGERFLMTETKEARPNNQDFDVRNPTTSTDPSDTLLKPILAETLSQSSGESCVNVARVSRVSRELLDSIPDWIPPSQRQQRQQSPHPPKNETLKSLAGNILQHPPPPPGFENSLLHSSTTTSAFSPPKLPLQKKTQTPPPPETPAFIKTDSVRRDPVSSVSVGDMPKTGKKHWSKPVKIKNTPPKQQAVPSIATSSYRAAVVSNPIPVKQNPKQNRGDIQRKKNQIQNHGNTNPDQGGRAKLKAAHANGTGDGLVASSSHSRGGSGTMSDPSSNCSMEDDGERVALLSEDEFHIQTESHRSSEESEWSQIVRPTSHQSRPMRDSTATATPRLNAGSSTISSKDAFLVLEDDEETEKSGGAEIEETCLKEVKSTPQSTSQTKAPSQPPAKQKNNTRRQQQQQAKTEPAPKSNTVSPSDDGKIPDGLDAFLAVFVSATSYFYEAVSYIYEVSSQVVMWIYEILIPAMRQSVLTTVSSAMHSLRGIFLLLLAAFHAYSFAADETLAQINLESAWIPYVSLVYAPTATRHVMNFVDLPHFTPHLVSSAVLCFLFRRPGGSPNQKRGPGKPTNEDIRNFLLRCCQIFIPFDLVMDGFSSVNTSIMTLSYTDRLLLAYVICVVRKGWMLVPCAWLSFAAQCLVAVYFPWKHILAEPILLFVLFSIGMASLNVLRILEHWKQRAKKAIGKNA